MAHVSDILAAKDSVILSIRPDASALDAAMLMNEHKVGALIVVQSDRMVGIISERDLLRRVIAQRHDPAGTLVRDVMTTNVICCEQTDDVEAVREIMREKRIRHIPVMDGVQKPLGMISIGDLNAWQIHGHEKTIHYLHEYIHGAA